MALFHILAIDKPGSLSLRMENRPAHLDWAKAQGDKLKLAGPVFDDDGETFAGSMFLVEAESHAEIEAWQAADPYVQAGLFGEIHIHPFKWVIGAPE